MPFAISFYSMFFHSFTYILVTCLHWHVAVVPVVVGCFLLKSVYKTIIGFLVSVSLHFNIIFTVQVCKCHPGPSKPYQLI